tara:strand:+ start:576 stop:1268 length:693 start_codon:yes stop_codon:yes gene_type:complete
MSKILASIKNISEAKILINSEIDIIDLKDPSNGALGKLENNDIKDIINFIDKKKLTSSTIGDLPNDGDLISKIVDELSNTDIDFIKIGVYENNYINTLSKIKSCKKLIAVFFADKFLPTNKEILILKKSGFSGVMIDTSNKNSGNLFNHVSDVDVHNFILNAKKLNLLTGIAGSINSSHINQIVKLNPNYMGFRGALCEDKKIRSSKISATNVNNIVHLVKVSKNVIINA